jgi:hypothetical protein
LDNNSYLERKRRQSPPFFPDKLNAYSIRIHTEFFRNTRTKSFLLGAVK